MKYKTEITLEKINGVTMVVLKSSQPLPPGWKGNENGYVRTLRYMLEQQQGAAIEVKEEKRDGPISVLDKVSDLIH
jgi:hypothetical protein